MSTELTIDKKEYKNVRIGVVEFDGETVTVTNQVFAVYDEDDGVVQVEAAASVENNGTVTARVFGLVDARAAAFVSGNRYRVEFIYDVATEHKVKDVYIRVN